MRFASDDRAVEVEDHPSETFAPAVDERAVNVEHLSVTYRTAYERKPTLKRTLVQLGRRRRSVRDVHALTDVSFDVAHGAVLGIVGVNGAGTSTLSCSEGLAAGFSREEIEGKYDEIAEFAELGDFMDAPMRSYSSGMYGRLAFSVAVNTHPDTLLIDEALSVGDARFNRKSFDKMRELSDQARTILIVSHALRSIRELCSEVIWLHKAGSSCATSPTR